jgi:hypothetical protein
MTTDIYYTYASKKELLDIGAEESTIFEDISELSELADHKDVPFLNQVELTQKQCAKLIPEGNYCYGAKTLEDGFVTKRTCPFWAKLVDFPKQSNGYCHYLKQGDWQGGLALLWDQCKCCGVNEYKEDYNEE